MLETTTLSKYRENSSFLLIYSAFTRDCSDGKWSTFAISGPELLSPHFPVFIVFKKCLCGPAGVELCLNLQHLSQKWNIKRLPLLYCSHYKKCSDEIHSMVPPVWIIQENNNISKIKTEELNSQAITIKINITLIKNS